MTCLGSGFFQGLEVMFGENQATTTTFWGDTSLVCLLPPATLAGSVPVTFKHQHQQASQFPSPSIPKQQVFFKYIDDDEQQIIKTALGVLHHKMTGKMEDVRDIARRVVGETSLSSWNSNGHNGGGAQSQHSASFGTPQFDVDPKDVEGCLLKVLDLIDLDDSPQTPRLNYRTASGQTMLHLACSLGFHRFVAALLARGASPLPRDRGGFTPLHFAALRNHPQIVRRLLLFGADPTMRSLLGYTPADLAISEEVLLTTRRIHSRRCSNVSTRSRTGSVASMNSLPEPLPGSQSNGIQATSEQATSDSSDDSSEDDSVDDGDPYDVDSEEANVIPDDGMWRRPIRSERARAVSVPIPPDAIHMGGSDAQSLPGLASPTAAMVAFRDQTTAYLQHIQQSMHLNFPNLPPMQMPTLPDYQAYIPTNPMVRRLSSMVPHRASPPSSVDGKEHDHKWWELFSNPCSNPGSTAPPAYDDIFPATEMGVKRSSAAWAAADALADSKCAIMFDEIQGQTEHLVETGSNTTLENVRHRRKQPLSEELQNKLRLAHAERVKRLKSDRKLFFIWIPLLVAIILAMSYNRVPQVASFLRDRYNGQGRMIDVQ